MPLSAGFLFSMCFLAILLYLFGHDIIHVGMVCAYHEFDNNKQKAQLHRWWLPPCTLYRGAGTVTLFGKCP
jgi:hypothetical protein